MFCDKLSNLKSYSGVCPAIKTVCDFIEKNDLSALPAGRTELSDGVFVNISEYEPYPSPDKWEAHRRYADLQVVISGDERMDGASIEMVSGGSGYDETGDYELFDCCGGYYATIWATEGTFAYFAPCDAHRPGLHYKADRVKKAVFKIPV